jgi:hypothetical protein
VPGFDCAGNLDVPLPNTTIKFANITANRRAAVFSIFIFGSLLDLAGKV